MEESEKKNIELINILKMGVEKRLSIYNCISDFLKLWYKSNFDINCPHIDHFIGMEDQYHDILAAFNISNFDEKDENQIKEIRYLDDLLYESFNENCRKLINILQ